MPNARKSAGKRGDSAKVRLGAGTDPDAKHRGLGDSGRKTRTRRPLAPGPEEAIALDAAVPGFLKLIEGEIIPRLMLAHRASRLDRDHGEGKDVMLGEAEVERLTDLTLNAGYEGCSGFVMSLRRLGASDDQLLLNLLAPVARRLGSLWETDATDFVAVTVGLGHLQTLMRELGRTAAPAGVRPGGARSAYLSTVPGEQHSFGLLVVEDHLRRAGWEVFGEIVADRNADLAPRVERQWFASACLSMSDARWEPEATRCIERLRARSKNTAIFVLVGGVAFQSDAALCQRIGADAVARDGAEAVVFLEKNLADQGLVDYQDARLNALENQLN